MVTISDLSQLLNTQTAAKLATVSKTLKKHYNHRLTGRKELGKVVAHKAALEGKRRKKEAIQRIFNNLVLIHGNIPNQVNYNVNQMINVYRYLNGHRLNIIDLLKIRRDQQALMRKLKKARERFNNKIQQEINTSGWN